MIRLLTRRPHAMLMSIFPFYEKENPYDKPVDAIIEPLNDELGWDRIKRIFTLDENRMYSKELQSIINVTLSGFTFGLGLGGMMASKKTVNDFIMHNEATKFSSHFEAKHSLQDSVVANFLKKGGKLGARVATFCFIFSSITTCTTAYRGKLAVENYMLGGSITGLLFKMNLGLRATLVGTGVGTILGGLCGVASILILKLSGITLDEVLDAQHQWLNSRNEKMREQIKDCMEQELPEIKKLYDENMKLRDIQQKEDNENQNKVNS